MSLFSRFALCLLVLSGSPSAVAANLAALFSAGDAAFNRADYREAEVLYRQALATAEAQPLDYAQGKGEALNNLAALSLAQGKLDEFRRYFELAKAEKQRRKPTLSPQSSAPLLVNGGFEDGLVFPWGTGHYERSDGRFQFGLWWNSLNAQAFMKTDCAERHSGHCSLRASNYSPLQPHVFSTVSQRISGLSPNTVYQISYWAKAENLAAGAVSVAIDAAWAKRLPALPPGTYDWQPLSATINLGHNDYLDFRLIHQNTGTVWLDDLVVEELFEAEEADPFQQVEALYNAGHYAEALTAALALEQRLADNPGGLARSQQFSGRIYLAQGRYAQALPRLQQAAALIPRASIDLAEVYFSLGDYANAEIWFDKAYRIVTGDQGTESLVLNRLSACYLAQNRLNQALNAQRQSYQILQHIEDQHGQALALLQLGLIYQRQADYPAASAQHRLSLSLATQLDDPKLASEARLSLAESLWHSGDPRSAQTELSLALNSKQALGDSLGLVQALRLQSQMLRKDAPAAAVLFGKQAVNHLQSLRATLSHLDKPLQQAFARDKAAVYQELADLLIDSGRLAEAQQVLGMSKEEEYFDFLQRDTTTDPRAIQSAYTVGEQPWLARYQQISGQLAALGRELGALKEQARQGALNAEQQARRKQLRSDIQVANQAFEAWLGELKTTFQQADAAKAMAFGEKNLAQLRPLQDTLRTLGHGAVLLHYLITPDKLRIILTTPDVQLARDAPVTAKALHHQILAFREALQVRTRQPLREAQALYATLIAPVAEDLRQAGAATLMLSLDGALRYVPVAALHDGDHYLVERYALVSYSEAARNNLARPPLEKWRVAGLGLSEARGEFNPLPAVAAELESIVRRSADDHSGVLDGVIYLNQAFTAEALLEVLDAGYPVVHIASHFVFSPGTERASYLLLGDGSALSLAEIRDSYDFNSLDLLTLSACNTALGDNSSGQEIDGFGALAQNRGAKGVLATLWPVNDASTGEFMHQLYAKHSGGFGKAESLRQVQRAFLQDSRYRHPYYWGAFILMGNWL